MVEILRSNRSIRGEEVLIWALRLTGDRQPKQCSEEGEARSGPRAASPDLEKLKERRFIEGGEGEDRVLGKGEWSLSLEEALRRADEGVVACMTIIAS